MCEVVIKNDTDGEEPLELSLFVKEVAGDFALFLAMLDHEGNNHTLEEQQWSHLDGSRDQLAEEFTSIFDSQQHGEITVAFHQFEFGAFYDVTSSQVSDSPVSVCEYEPLDTPDGFDWQHAIVIWQGDWIRCYYCREIHERNIDIF